MAFTITGSLTIDETTGTQNAAASGDSTGNDVAGGLGTLIANVPEFDALLSLVVAPGVLPTNVSVSNANADNSTGSSLLTGFGVDVVDLAFTNSTGGPLAGEPAKFGGGAGDFLTTTDGTKIYLYSYSGPDDPTLDENNVVFGRKANSDGTANPAGAIVFAAYLQPTGAGDVALGSDVDALGAKVWLVEYEPLEHGIDGASAAAHDDARILVDPLYVSVGTRSEFSLEGAPSGQNLFLTFGDGTPAAGEVAIVVTAEHPANQSTGESITKGQTVNTGQGGGGTTIGNTNQMVDPGEGLFFSFVNGANDQLTVPNLDQNEADLESNIQFSGMFGALGASFAVVQLQQDSQASLTITALNTAAEPGANYIDGLGVGAGGDTIVNINWVKVSTFVKTGNTLSPGPTYVFTSDFYDPVSGASVDFKADGTVELIGLQANDVVSYRTGDSGGVLTHNRVLIRNSGDPIANASDKNAAFDIGKFSVSNAATDTDAFPALAFEDDGPSVSTTGTLPVLTVDETVLATDATGDFSGNFSATFGADGFGAGSYALAAGSEGMDSLLVDTASGNHVFLRTEAGAVVGREGTDATDAITGDIVFTVSVSAAGVVTLDQQRAVVHDDPLDPDESTSPAMLAAGMVILTGTATDGDGDTASAALNIGDRLNFEDDGPSVSTTGTLPVLTVDETVLATDATGDFSGNFSATFGADGFGAGSYALAAGSEGMDSLLVDTASGNHVFLYTEAGVVVGREGTDATDAIGGDIVFTVSVSAAGVVTLDQQRAVVHDDPLDHDESTSPATLAAGMVILTGTATDGDGDTASAPLNIGDKLNFEDDGPSLAVGNLVGTGTVLPQIGYWAGSFGNDGAGATGLDIALTGFTLVRPDSSTTTGTYTFGELPLSPDGTGAYLFGGSLTGDFDNNASTANTSVDFTLTAYANGSYALDLVQGFSSTVTTSTASGGLGAGGPDPVQTLYIPPPPATPTETVVFFSAKPLAADADILSGIGLGASDPTETDLQTTPLPGYIDPRSMNVSTSGIGVDNNLLQGYGTAATEAVDESFVANPLSLVSSMEVFVDNSVGGYSHSDGEMLYYKVFYEDGTDSDNVLVTADLGLANKGQPLSFTVSGGGKMIDAIQLTMASGEIKVPEIRFTTLVESLANDVKLDFSATLTDKDGDTATSAFSADLFANEIAGLFDFLLVGTASAQDAFNIDLLTAKNKYQVSGFDTGTDTLVLIGDATAVVTNIDNSGADSIVTITETGAQVTTVTVVGVDLLGTHVAFG